MDLNLKKKIILITGASRGLGYVIAESFLKQHAKVIITSTNRNNLKNAYLSLKKNNKFYDVFPYEANHESLKSLEELKKKIKKKFKGIDVLINNIGSGTGTNEYIIKNNDWKKSWDKNFTSFKNTFDTFYDLIQKKSGNLIAISSIVSDEFLGAPIEYSVAKKSLDYFCKNISKKVDKNVRINVVAPGNILINGNSWDKKLKKNKIKVLNYIKSNVPLQRFASGEEIANVVLFLSSSKASFIHGSRIVVDGGQTNH